MERTGGESEPKKRTSRKKSPWLQWTKTVNYYMYQTFGFGHAFRTASVLTGHVLLCCAPLHGKILDLGEAELQRSLH